MMNPFYVMGIIDAEGCFYVQRDAKYNRVSFNISNNDRQIMDLFVEFFEMGSIYKRKKRKGFVWNIGSKADLKKLVEFIEEYGPRCSEHHKPLLVKMVNRPRHGHKPITWEEWSSEAKTYYNKPDSFKTTQDIEKIKQILNEANGLRGKNMTYNDIADKLNIKLSTLNNWRKKYDDPHLSNISYKYNNNKIDLRKKIKK